MPKDNLGTILKRMSAIRRPKVEPCVSAYGIPVKRIVRQCPDVITLYVEQLMDGPSAFIQAATHNTLTLLTHGILRARDTSIRSRCAS